ncbi:GNAT family N-acetyltransferase [Ferrimicrobium acidiphilum]|uniref:GNAT family N-acetyltransferase n=1 Tax=Ferrimicrobium acidiphilum TaxID=121039 RepID=A0ABV3XZU2_9ACTN
MAWSIAVAVDAEGVSMSHGALAEFWFVPPEVGAIGSFGCRRFVLDDVDRVYDAVYSSKGELIPWMPWAKDYHRAMAEEFVRRNVEAGSGDTLVNEVSYVVHDDEHPFLGSFGLMGRLGVGTLEIGYWVDSRYTRQGIATRAAALLTEAALTIPTVSAIEIHHDRANHASGAVASRLGYRKVSIRSRHPQAPGEEGVEVRWRMERSEWLACAGAQLLARARGEG